MQAIWTGTISFGLIHIPIKLYSATKDEKPAFRLLRKEDLCPIKYLRVCRADGEEVSYENIVKGYEYEKGDYVVLDKEDFKKADQKRSQTIEISQFTPKEEISEELFVKPYFVEPDKGAEKAYVLLREAMEQAGKVGIAEFILRNKEHLVALYPKNDLLMINALRYKSELKETRNLEIPKKAEFSKKELDIAIELIKQMEEPFKFEKFKDTYSEELMRVIESKKKGKPLKVKEMPSFEPDVADIMDKLKRSLEEAKKR